MVGLGRVHRNEDARRCRGRKGCRKKGRENPCKKRAARTAHWGILFRIARARERASGVMGDCGYFSRMVL
jgi:hypothetical protein